MATHSTATVAAQRPPRQSWTSSAGRRATELALPLAVIATWAVLRWSGTPPFGSDNDEYRLVAEALLDGRPPLVAGVEATKYPLGYPLLLAAFGALGLPVTGTALALNLALMVALATTVLLLAHSLSGRIAAVPAAVYAVAGVGVWGSVFVTMPDLAFVCTTAVVLWAAGRLRDRRDVWVLVGLVALATLMKSVGLLVALAASVAVAFAAPSLRRLAWAPAAAGVLVTGAMWAINAPHPTHTTGYARTFLLVDPTDAAAGDVSLLGVLARLPERAHLVLRDLEWALVGPHVGRPWSWLIAATLLGAGIWAVWRGRSRRAFVLAFLAIWLPAMAVWPYSSVRFQLPLVPLAAVGVGWLAAAAARRLRAVGAALVVVILGLYLVTSAGELRRGADAEAARIGAVAEDTQAVAAWGREHIPPDEPIASFAYREIAYRLDRPVVPLGYTSDMGQLLDEADAGGAQWVVVMPSLYGARGQLELQFLATFPDRLRLAYDTPTVDVYELLGPA